MFLLEAATLGLLGGLFGGGVGRAVVAVLNRQGIPMPAAGSSAADRVRPVISAGFIGLAVAVATLAALLSAAYPSWKASRMNPVDALRST